MRDDLFGEDFQAGAEKVLMSLNPEYYELIWAGEKTHEFRRRYLLDRATTWFVYLTAPVSRLAAVIELDPAVVDSPTRIAEIAERARTGNGRSVYDYLADLERGFALPIRTVREYAGVEATQLAARLGKFHPPQGYTLVTRNPALARICEELTTQPVQRELAVAHPTPVT